jgi:beta-glucosidase
MDETTPGLVPGASGYLASSLNPAQVDDTPLSVLDAPWTDASLSPDERAALLLGQMALAEKIAVVHGEYGPYGFYNTPLPRLGIPALTMADGPTGIHVSNAAVNEGKATALPAPIALAATWDPAVAERYGDVIGAEAEATGHNVFLGPGLDIARVPVFGRLFEALGEDPRLTGQMAAGYIRGVQGHPIVACAKHYNMNTQEQQRTKIDVHVDERTLREIYTLPFAIAVEEAQPGAAMGAFNKVNGLFACEQPHLLTDILKRQVGFTGWVMSDYGATQSTVEAANAGLDQEMPAATFFGDRLMEVIKAGQVSMATLDDKARRILRTMFARGLFEHPVQIHPFPIQEHGQWAKTIASQGIVLLKNSDTLLPLASDALHAVAVIGADADANIAGGGSSLVKPTYLVSIREGIRRRTGASVPVTYAEGVDPPSAADLLPGPPPVPSSVLTPAGFGAGIRGLHAEYWANTRFAGEPDLVRTDRQVALNYGFFNYPGFNASSLPPTPVKFNNSLSARWTGSITAPATGDYTLSLTHLGTARLSLDDRRLIDDPGVTLSTQSATVHLVAGEPHALRIEYASDRPDQGASSPGSDANGGYGGYGGGGGLVGAKLRLGWERPVGAISPLIQEAAALAARSDVAVVVVRDYSNEDADRPSLTLPNEQDVLVRAVAAANPRTIVALATGGAATMPWLDQVPAVLECWYGGQEMGSALASVLFGDVNPSGKLPVTFPRSDGETPLPASEQYPGVDGIAQYSEGLGVGYRGYDQRGLEPLFPFGYGLSYTDFTYSDLIVESEMGEGTRPIQVRFMLTNTGSRAGAEIAQVYLGLPARTGEPPKRLVGWTKAELEPGETRAIGVTLDPTAPSRPLSSWNVDTDGWEIAYGDYAVYVGASSRDIRLTGALRV